MIVFGVDPDSSKHGVAIFEDGKLIRLLNLELMEIYDLLVNELIVEWGKSKILFSIENVKATSAAFNARDKRANQNVKLKMAQHIGQCKQAQIELERLLDHLGVKYIHQKISKNWKSQTGKKQFEMVTGWKGRSNEDSRSACYMGFLACK